MKKAHDLLKQVNLPESQEALQLLTDKVGVHEYYTNDFKEMGIRADLETIYVKRAKSLRKLNTKQGKELAKRIDAFLHRKREGDCIHQYYSLTFRNGAVYEFWAFENGWEGWRNYDDENVDEDEQLNRLLDDI
ncbi:MAG: hypothetical protein HQ515_16370 [Phycisphaeraceae bacterium]|nr:hypothetical protein [Phycisphaeraceae bacterium]